MIDGRRTALPDASLNRCRGVLRKGEATAFLRMGLKVGLDKNLDGLVAGVNFDADRCIAEIDFGPPTVVSPDDRVGHWVLLPPDSAMFAAP